ncbi:MAG: type IIL restriction-modification enzyme MmeI [Candidatus Brocadiia bacterium]
MNVSHFIAKWRSAELSERSGAQQHFLDLCRLVDHPPPAEADATGEQFTFEKLTEKHGGKHGWADVWYRGRFAWEYKGNHKDLEAAFDQLLQYRANLENPPLLVVSTMRRIVVHTNFTSTPTEVHELTLDDLNTPRGMEILRAVFHHPEKLKPGITSQAITADAAEQIAGIAQRMRERGLDPHLVARFLDRIVFCLFAEDIDLLPEGLFSRLLEKNRRDPERFARVLGRLWDAMAEGGEFGADDIRHFNGSLFTRGPVLGLTEDEIGRVHAASQLDWSAVDPSIFGTLFERGLDPDKRSQIGAHYTSREDIETLVEPVVMWPLRREWDETRETVENLLRTGRKDGHEREGKMPKSVRTRSRNESDRLLRRFHDRLTQVKVLDPACGSGNFLYVTLQKLKDLEKEVILFAAEHRLGQIMAMVGPWQLYGIEISPYAFDLAQMVVWIGYIQWTRSNGFQIDRDPVLTPMEGRFENKDAILDLSDPENPKEPDWPKVDYIVGNPPFLGGKLMREYLGDDYVDRLFDLWEGRVPHEADLCCYWFEKARAHLADGKCQRAGLLATQGIRGGANRTVLEHIKETGDIFFAESDRPWVLDGASVHVSMVGFHADDQSLHGSPVLDGTPVEAVHANLTGTVDVTQARQLPENAGLSFMGDTKGGPFDIEPEVAEQLLRLPNPHGRPNSEVVVPWLNGRDVTQRSRDMWIIDFFGMDQEAAALCEAPFKLVKDRVQDVREESRTTIDTWWQHERPRPEMRAALETRNRFPVTSRVAKHRLFSWVDPPTLPDCQLIVFARADDYFLGVLHSRLHEVWALRQGTRLETRPRYTPTTCFETFPFPWPPGKEPKDDAPYGERVKAIAEAAAELNELRENWLNPPEFTVTEVLEFPGSTDGPWARYVEDPDERGIGTVRYPRTAPDPPFADTLKKRTLTNLYNEYPTWLENAHASLDKAVFAAYRAATNNKAWTPEMTDEDLLEQLLELNLARAEGI